MGPHPAVARTRLAVREVLAAGDTVFVACSGGPDSVALAAAVAFEAPRAGVRAGLVTIDHGLQDAAAEQAARVVELGRSLGLEPVESIRVDVGPSGGPEGAAREARYAALGGVAGRREAGILLGHTRDDQAETVLLGLGRGSGPRSIAGMRRRDGLWIRPFLDLDRVTTVAACAAQGLPTWDDPMNDDPRYTRVRLRREVLPLLEEVLHGGVAASLARTADLLREDVDALDAWADDVYGTALVAVPPPPSADQQIDFVDMRRPRSVDHRDGVGRLPVTALESLPAAIRTRVLRRWAAGQGAGPLTAVHTAALDALVVAWRGQGPVALPGGVAVRTPSGTLEFVPATPPPALQE